MLCLGSQVPLVHLSNDDLTVSKRKDTSLQEVGHLEKQLTIDIMLPRASIQCIKLCLASRTTHFALFLGPHMDSISKDKDYQPGGGLGSVRVPTFVNHLVDFS